MRDKILELLKSNESYLSGEDISRRMDVSRTAIWKHIQALKQEGYDIESHPRLGYRLRQIPDRLLPEEIRPRLNTVKIGRGGIHYFSEVASTNNEAKKLAAAGCAEGTIVLAEAQNGGRGRLSRGWFSPFARGIWLSVVLRPPFSPQEAPKCTMMAAVAVNRAIRRVAGIESGIKWPNDILCGGKKLVGILTEMSAEMDAINHIVIGIGMNVNIAPEDFPPDLAPIATSLAAEAGKPVSRLELLAAVLAELDKIYQHATAYGFGEVLQRWRQESVTLGQEVTVLGVSKQFSGLAVDIDEDGALLVKTPDGIEKVLAGDVSIRPKQ
ncbi:MAG: biotin--[acetyl-CoA-carboxylase] ligase [Negativicutes bacterium]|nr:biotin--[acetyl-CoA-carboxylase] ligase [Negativicutes bacterium]